jgi:hypothetical protein
MKNRENSNLRTYYLVEKGKWKPSNNNTPNGIVNLGVHFRSAANSLSRFVNAEDKLRAKPLSLMFIPDNRISKLAFSFRMEADSHSTLRRLEELSLDFFPRASLREGLRASIKFLLFGFG